MTSLALNDTYHFGMHNITIEDTDDNFTDSASTPTSHGTPNGQDSDDTGKDSDHKNDGDSDGRTRRLRDRLRRLSDSDDPGFTDPPVSVQFSFTGNFS